MAVYTFKNLYQMVLQQTDEKLDANTARDTVKDLINTAHELRCTEFPEFLLWDTKETFSTVNAQQGYSLHQLFDKPLYFYNQTSKVRMTQTPRRNIEEEIGGLSADVTGTARHFSLQGHMNVKAQPSSSSTLSLVSDHTSDTGTDYQVIIKGINTSNELVAESVTLTGTTPVTTSNTYSKVLSISKERVMNGQLTVTSNSDTVTILRLLPDEFGRQYQQLWLHQRPTNAEIIEYRFYRKPSYLVNDYDIPDIPAPYSRLLVYDALLQWGAYNTDTQDKTLTLWKEMQMQWEKRLYDYVKEGQSLGAQTRKVRNVAEFSDVGMDIAR
jgi:hypothetical protein